MSDDDVKKDSVDETQDEAPQDAGPVVESDSPSSQAAGEEPDTTPPASGEPADGPPAAEEDSPDDAPAEEEAPAAAAPEPAEDPDPEDDLPWKERRRLQHSRRPNDPKPALTPEERAAQRREHRKAKANERRKGRAAMKAKQPESGDGTPAAEREANAAKVRQGIVVSNKGDKSITVRIDIARRHPTYEKIVRRSRTLHAHDERNEAGEGDVVRVVETRPLSKTKRWRLVDVVEKAR